MTFLPLFTYFEPKMTMYTFNIDPSPIEKEGSKLTWLVKIAPHPKFSNVKSFLTNI